MAEHNLQTYRDFIVEIALQAGEVLKKHIGESLTIEYKDREKHDLLTKFDKQTEEFLVKNIRQRYPDHAIIGEEGGTGAADTLKNATHRWIIDPIDGTTNFAHGHPFFAISIGLEVNGEMVLGVVNAPVLQELYIGVKGLGSTLNGKPIHVSNVKTVQESLLTTGFNPRVTEENFPHFKHFQTRCHGIRRGGAASLDLCYVAAGRIDGYWEFGLKAWDMAAGVVIIQEAGGKVTNATGGPLNLFGEEILTTNGFIHKEMEEYFQKNPFKKSL